MRQKCQKMDEDGDLTRHGRRGDNVGQPHDAVLQRRGRQLLMLLGRGRGCCCWLLGLLRRPLRLEPDAHHGDGLELPPLGVGVLLLDVGLQLLGVGGAVAAVLADVVADLVVPDLEMWGDFLECSFLI